MASINHSINHSMNHFMNHFMNNHPINVHNLYKYMINLYKLGVIPEFNVHFNSDLTEMIFVTEYNSTKWGQKGTSIITYNINKKKWKTCINTKTIDELVSKYPYLFEKSLFTGITTIIEEYLTFESDNIDDILEPALNPFDTQYLDINCNYDLRNLYTINKKHIHNMYFSNYQGFINNIIQDKSNINYE